MSPSDFQQQLLSEALLVLDPVLTAVTSPWRREALVNGIGWDLGAIAGMTDEELNAWLDDVAAAVSGVAALIEHPPATLDDVAAVLGALQAAADALRNLPPALRNIPTDTIPAGLFAGDLISYLLIGWLERRHPRLLHILRLLTLVRLEIESNVSEPLPASGRPMRLARPRAELRLAQFPLLLRDPVGVLQAEYLPGGLQTDSDAELAAKRLFGRVADLLAEMGVQAPLGLGQDPGPLDPASEYVGRTMLTIRVPYGDGDVSGTFGATFALSSVESGDLGLVVVPRGDLTFTQAAGGWGIRVDVSAAAGGFAIGRQGLTLPDEVNGSVTARVEAAKIADPGVPAVLVGSATGTRLEIGALRFAVEGALGSADEDYGFLAEASNAAIVVAAGDGDGFLKQVLPPDGIRTNFDLALGWSRSRGLAFRGSANLEAVFPVGKDIAGVATIDAVQVAIRPVDDAVVGTVSVTASVQLGPVRAAIDRFGLTATLTFPEGGGNLGAADLALAFQPPAGAALTIEAGAVSGGGYLMFDPVREQYTGAVHLELAEKLNITAVGLLTTRMPDGSPGFSLLVLMSVRFTPGVPLAYGFTLTGVGGLLGVNRMVEDIALRAGLRTGTVGRILLADDPARNAPQIVSDLQAVFPPASGRFVFGPLIQLTWGTPKPLVTMDIGLVLELPAPVRLFIFGRVRVVLPEESGAVVRLQLDAAGSIDFERGDVALDAYLFDSQLAEFTVTGQMALRASFGARPNFVLAVGGLHPRFQAPQGFPPLERMAINLATTTPLVIVRLRLAAYLAVTSNTVQFGADLDLFFQASGFTVQGALAFDTLIQFSPFGLIADVRAAVAVKCGTKSLMAVTLALTVSGPSPWRAHGKATFAFLVWTATLEFDERFGVERPFELPRAVRITPQLVAALREPGNWATQLPAGQHPVVTLRDTPPGGAAIYVHPLADLQVRQRVVPLGRDVTRMGTSPVDGDHYFTLAVVGPGGVVLNDPSSGVESIDDQFAPAQYTDMTDDEKLVAPAFESMPAGLRFGVRRYTAGVALVEDEMAYERKTVYGPSAPPSAAPEMAAVAMSGIGAIGDLRNAAVGAAAAPHLGDPRGPAPLVVRPGWIERVASVGAAGVAPLARSGLARFAGPRRAIGVAPQRFVAITGRSDRAESLPSKTGSPKGAGGRGSYAEASQARLDVGDSKQRRRVKIVPSYVEAQP